MDETGGENPERVLFCGPSPFGFVAVTQQLERSVGDGSVTEWRRRLRFFPPQSGDGEDAVSDTAQGEVLVRMPLSQREVDAVPDGGTQEERDIAILQLGAVVDNVLCLGYHRAFLAAMLCEPAVPSGRCVVLGNGCGAFSGALLQATALHIDGVEIDRGVSALAGPVFGFRPPKDRFTLHSEDGIAFLKAAVASGQAFDWIFVDINASACDAAVSGFAAPEPWFWDRPGAECMRAALATGGRAVINILPVVAPTAAGVATGAPCAPSVRDRLLSLLTLYGEVFGCKPITVTVEDNTVLLLSAGCASPSCDGVHCACAEAHARILTQLRTAALPGTPLHCGLCTEYLVPQLTREEDHFIDAVTLHV